MRSLIFWGKKKEKRNKKAAHETLARSKRERELEAFDSCVRPYIKEV